MSASGQECDKAGNAWWMVVCGFIHESGGPERVDVVRSCQAGGRRPKHCNRRSVLVICGDNTQRIPRGVREVARCQMMDAAAGGVIRRGSASQLAAWCPYRPAGQWSSQSV